jgi:acetyl esterase/lipase
MPTATAEAVAPSPATSTFLDDLEATVYLPSDTAGPVPLVVLGAAGYWHTADTILMEPLAEDLAARGAAVVLVPYRVAWENEALYPLPVQDMACGTAYAAEAVGGLDVSKVVVAGSSASAYMGALIALTPEAFTTVDCPYEAVTPDAFIGIDGPYDPAQWDVATGCRFFGCEAADQKAWDGGNAMELADLRPEVPALLIHGALDEFTYPSVTQEFGDALTSGGHDVTVNIVDGAGATDAQSPNVAGPIIGSWLGLSGEASASSNTSE